MERQWTASVVEILRRNRDPLISAWQDKVCDVVPEAREQKPLELRNRLPQFLDLLVEIVEAGSYTESHDRRLRALAREHGEQRARATDFDLKQIALEYKILRRTVFDLIYETAPPPHEILCLINGLIDDGIGLATQEFVDREGRRRDEANRRLRELHGISESAALRKKSLQDLLDEAVAYIRGAIPVDTVSVLLLTEGENQLVVRAAQGLKKGGGKRIAEQTLESGDSTVLNEPAEVESIEAPLAEEGIRYVMCVPLRTGDRPIGTINLGRASSVPFQENELSLLQLVADRVATTIDNARLYEETRRYIEQLEGERTVRELFVTSLSHDMRTPLTTAKTNLQILLRAPAREDLRERNLNRALGGVERVDRMIQNLLDANSLRAGQPLPVKMEHCDLSSVVRSALDELSGAYGDRFELDAPAELWAQCDAEAVRRVVENLGGNAVKYGASGTPVQVTLTDRDRRIELRVHNDGPEIPPSKQALLFEPFRRSVRSAGEGPKGWGVGLALVRGLTASHGGRVSVESAPARGTTFTVELPKEAGHG